MVFRLLLLDPNNYSARAVEILRSVAVVDAESMSRQMLLTRIRDYDALVLRFAHRIDAEVLRAAERLKVVATNTTGLDHIDVAAADRAGVNIVSLRGETEFLETIWATAEHTWGLILALVRRLVPAANSVCSGVWQRDLFVGNELAGKRLGIVGLGRLGRKIARYAEAFAMEVSAYDPNPPEYLGNAELASSLLEMVGRSDILTIHAPANADTRLLIDKKLLAALPEGAFVVNTSRGSLVDENALLAGLKSGRIGGAALDVLANEHHSAIDQTHPLISYAREHDNLLITPHIGGGTEESWEKTEVFIANRVSEVLGELRQKNT